jgi:hypothetical protein
MIIDHIEKKIVEEVGKLRAEVNLKRASDDGEVVPLPNPLREWSGQALAAAKAELKSRISAQAVNIFPRSLRPQFS